VSRQSEEDFEGSLGSGGESDIDDNNLCSALVLCGPHGIGKTSMVYAVAKELGFKVITVFLFGDIMLMLVVWLVLCRNGCYFFVKSELVLIILVLRILA